MLQTLSYPEGHAADPICHVMGKACQRDGDRPGLPCKLPGTGLWFAGLSHTVQTHQGHDPHAVQILGSTSRGELGCGAATEWRRCTGQGEGGQGGGDRATLAQLCQVEGLHAAASHTGLNLLSTKLGGLFLLLDHPAARQTRSGH